MSENINSETDSTDYDNEYERKRALLRQRELTDAEAERIAEVTGQKDPGDLHERKVVPVSIKGDEVKIGSVCRFAGNEHIRWNDDVVGTFGGGGTTPDEVRRAFRDGKTRMIEKLKRDEEIAREFGKV